MNMKKYVIGLGIIAVLILGGWRFRHFVIQDVPLGYDPGRYRAMFLGYNDLLPHLNFSELNTWIKKVFPPFVGIFVSSRHTLTGISLDWIVSSGVAVQSLLVSVGIYFWVSPKNKTIALIAAGLSRISFVQYEVFWWNYIKQLRGMFFLLIVLGLFVRKKYRVALPIIVALAVTHRPALLSLVVIVGLRIVSEVLTGVFGTSGEQKIRREEEREKFSGTALIYLIGVGILAGLIALPIYREFIQLQIPRLFRMFENSIDIPQINDTFKSGGTFMTTMDFLRTNWVVLGLSGIGFVVSFWKSGWRWHQVAYIFGAIRVFGQLAFYQRMMGYADLFFLVFAGLAIREIAIRRRWGWIAGVIAFVIHGSIYAYWVERTWRPFIAAEEYAFLQTLPELLPPDAVVMNTHSGYSTWLKGRSERTTLSPGLFGDDRRNKTDWKEKMREAQGPEICQHLKDSYGDMTDKLYIWQGLTQVQMDLASGPCMSVFAEGESGKWTMYIADLEKKR